jgi:hypothetical protein
MNRSIWWGAGAGVAVLLMAAWLWNGARAPESELGSLPSNAATTAPANEMPFLMPQGAAGMSSSGAPQGAPEATGAGRPSAVDASRPRLEDIQAELQALSAGGRTPQVMELDAVFEKLERYNGSSQMGGVDLQLVRKNLQAAARIQRLSEQMKPLAADPTPENAAKIQALVAEMREAQAGLDVKGLMSAATVMQNLPGGGR